MTPMRKLWWTLATLLCVGLAIYSYRYFAPPTTNILGNALAKPWLWLHIAGAATALIVSPFQLLPWIRRRFPAIHRTAGRIYVIGCLAGGVGGFVAAFGSTAGPIATAGFGLLAPTWIFVTVQGWRAALQRRFQDHRRWMLRSFSLTFAAVTLRLYLPIGMVAGLSFVDIYRATAWISWIPNLVVMELYLRGAFRRGGPVRAALVTSDAS